MGAAFLAALLSAPAMAYPLIDASQAASLTVHAETAEGKAIKDLTFTLYKAADLTSATNTDVQFDVTEAFAKFAENTELKVITNASEVEESDWADAATTLDGIVRNAVAEGTEFVKVSAVTDQDGNASFTAFADGTPLGDGLYLMLADYTGSEYKKVEVKPVFLTVPQLSEDMTEWIYDVKVSAKVTAVTELPKTTKIGVRKIWMGDDSAEDSAKRPTSIVVRLLDNGTAVDEVTLDASNKWAHEWDGLDPAKTWSVMEKAVPDGYTTTSTEETQDGVRTILITNTKSGVFGEYRPPNKETEKKKSGVKGSSRSTTSEESAERLPQTGQLWWPVWVMAAAGVVLILIGLLVRRSGKHDSRESRG